MPASGDAPATDWHVGAKKRTRPISSSYVTSAQKLEAERDRHADQNEVGIGLQIATQRFASQSLTSFNDAERLFNSRSVAVVDAFRHGKRYFCRRYLRKVWSGSG